MAVEVILSLILLGLVIVIPIWVLFTLREIRDSLYRIVQQQEDMLHLQRIWTRFYEQQEEMLRLQREHSPPPPTTGPKPPSG